MVKNVKETIKLTGYMLLSKHPQQDYLIILREIIKNPTEDNKARLKEIEPDWIRDEMKALSLLPYQEVEVSISVGSVLFDLYIQATKDKIPKAPLAHALFINKRSEYAEIFDKDEFEIPQDVIDSTKDILLDDDKWNDTDLSASINNGTDLCIKSAGLGAYRNVMSEIINIFLGDKK